MPERLSPFSKWNATLGPHRHALAGMSVLRQETPDNLVSQCLKSAYEQVITHLLLLALKKPVDSVCSHRDCFCFTVSINISCHKHTRTRTSTHTHLSASKHLKTGRLKAQVQSHEQVDAAILKCANKSGSAENSLIFTQMFRIEPHLER